MARALREGWRGIRTLVGIPFGARKEVAPIDNLNEALKQILKQVGINEVAITHTTGEGNTINFEIKTIYDGLDTALEGSRGRLGQLIPNHPAFKDFILQSAGNGRITIWKA